MIPAVKVQEVLYNFSMYAFRDFIMQKRKIADRHSAITKVLELLESADFLTAEEATMLPNKQKSVLCHMMTWYITYLMYPEFPPFPNDFLFGSSEMRLNAPVLRYMHRHSSQVLDNL